MTNYWNMHSRRSNFSFWIRKPHQQGYKSCLTCVIRGIPKKNIIMHRNSVNILRRGLRYSGNSSMIPAAMVSTCPNWKETRIQRSIYSIDDVPQFCLVTGKRLSYRMVTSSFIIDPIIRNCRTIFLHKLFGGSLVMCWKLPTEQDIESMLNLHHIKIKRSTHWAGHWINVESTSHQNQKIYPLSRTLNQCWIYITSKSKDLPTETGHWINVESTSHQNQKIYPLSRTLNQCWIYITSKSKDLPTEQDIESMLNLHHIKIKRSTHWAGHWINVESTSHQNQKIKSASQLHKKISTILCKAGVFCHLHKTAFFDPFPFTNYTWICWCPTKFGTFRQWLNFSLIFVVANSQWNIPPPP